MTKPMFRKLTGILFVIGAILINIPYTLLIIYFEYPDILRQPTGYILTKFQAGGIGLIFIWFSFAWVGLPILFAIIMLQKIIERDDTHFLSIATFAGVLGVISQIIGLLRWVFVVPVLGKLYIDPNSTSAIKDAITIAFQVINQYGGVVIGEHIGQIFTIFWIIGVSFTILKSDIFKRWIAWFGLLTSAVYILAQSELISTVIPDFPISSEAGFIGSLMWLAWMLVVGVFLIRAK